MSMWKWEEIQAVLLASEARERARGMGEGDEAASSRRTRPGGSKGQADDTGRKDLIGSRNAHGSVSGNHGACQQQQEAVAVSTQLKQPTKAEKLRGKIWAETEGRCVYCNSSPPAKARTLDHIWPKTRGGTRTKLNLVGACAGCNVKRGTKIPASKHAHPKWQEHVRKKERAMGMNT